MTSFTCYKTSFGCGGWVVVVWGSTSKKDASKLENLIRYSFVNVKLDSMETVAERRNLDELGIK